jgi:hypothetical protein
MPNIQADRSISESPPRRAEQSKGDDLSHLVVRGLSGAAYAFDAHRDDTVRDLKQKLWEKEGVPSPLISLSHRGRVLGDDVLVGDCGLQPRCFQAHLRSAIQAEAPTSEKFDVEKIC